LINLQQIAILLVIDVNFTISNNTNCCSRGIARSNSVCYRISYCIKAYLLLNKAEGLLNMLKGPTHS